MLVEAIYYFKCDWCGKIDEIANPANNHGQVSAPPKKPVAWIEKELGEGITQSTIRKRIFCGVICLEKCIQSRLSATAAYTLSIEQAKDAWVQTMATSVKEARNKKVDKC